MFAACCVCGALAAGEMLQPAGGNDPQVGQLEIWPLPPVDGEQPPQPLVPRQTIDPDIAWWDHIVERPLRQQSEPLPVDVNRLVYDALQYSHNLRAISQTPLVRADDIVRAKADFDVRAFVESRFYDRSLPVGNTLTTGGPPRLNEHEWNMIAGVRKRTSTGASLELSQQSGFKNSNSRFFVPNDQGTAQMTLTFNQPLLSGAGKVYNSSLIVLAEIDTEVARDEFVRQLQDHLFKVNQAYWLLYLERAVLLQKRRHLARAEELQRELEGRAAVDSIESQVIRARSAVARRQAELARSDLSVRNAESRIRALVNAPYLATRGQVELIPRQGPAWECEREDVDDAVRVALQNRPEIDQSLRQIRAASVRLDMSRNEMLPALSLVLESYVNGLRGNSAVGDALVRQFNTGSPSYSAGLVFEFPVGNRAAHAKYRQRQRELTQLTEQFEASTAGVVADVEIAVREVQATHREMDGKYVAVLASRSEVDYLQQRWLLLPGDDRSASLYLEDILNAQERLAAEEASLAQAQVAYNIAVARMSQATGTLTQAYELPPAWETPVAANDVHLPQPARGPVPQPQIPLTPQPPVAAAPRGSANPPDSLRYPLPRAASRPIQPRTTER